jgi:iron complex transport system ATP-binding protein
MPTNATPMLECAGLTVNVPGRRLVDELDLALAPGEVVAVLGRNGSGKSLTLLTLAGLRAAGGGGVTLGGASILGSRRRTAQQLAFLPQATDDVFPATVLDTALTGRHPHIGLMRWESARDREIARAALATMNLTSLAERDVLTLSGGERRRLAIAQVLAQQPAVYLLDEPTNHLDPQHQLDALAVFRRAADEEAAAVLVSLHDVNLASRFADRCLLLHGDGRWRLGASAEVLDVDTLGELYATTMETVRWRSRNLFVAVSDHPAP